METWRTTEPSLTAAADALVARLGAPRLGVVLGSGFGSALAGLGSPTDAVAFHEVAGLSAPGVDGHGARIEAFDLGGRRVWAFGGRLHLYEGHSIPRIVQHVRLLRFAGAASVLLACAAGGLRDDDRPGSWIVVEDHLNLTGSDPIASIPADLRSPAFPDLQGVYDAEFRSGWASAARRGGVRSRPGVLASVPGPCYETPAEVRMLRTLGADAVTMSTVLEAIVARYLGLRVAALACVANRGAGMLGGELRHEDVVAAVSASAARGTGFLRDGLQSMLAAADR